MCVKSSSSFSLKYLWLNETLLCIDELVSYHARILTLGFNDWRARNCQRQVCVPINWRVNQEKRVYHTVEKKASLPNSEFYHSFIPKLLLTKVRKVFAVITSPASNSLYRPQLGFSLKLSIMRKREEKRQRPAAPVTVRHQLEKIKWHSFEEGEWPDVSMDLSSQTGSWSRWSDMKWCTGRSPNHLKYVQTKMLMTRTQTFCWSFFLLYLRHPASRCSKRISSRF